MITVPTFSKWPPDRSAKTTSPFLAHGSMLLPEIATRMSNRRLRKTVAKSAVSPIAHQTSLELGPRIPGAEHVRWGRPSLRVAGAGATALPTPTVEGAT